VGRLFNALRAVSATVYRSRKQLSAGAYMRLRRSLTTDPICLAPLSHTVLDVMLTDSHGAFFTKC
jgi:hypothetical protein